jgi:hypothetical protein
MPSLKQLDVSHNDLTVLESNLSTLSRLQQLTLSFNKLQNIQDIHFLQPLTKLRILALEGNPLTRRPDYRREVFLFLGERLELDQLPWSYAEIMSMERSRILGKRLQEKNDGNMWKNAVHVVNSATVSSHQRSTIAIIYPKLDPGNIKPCTAGIVKIANPSNGNITKQLLSSVSLSLTPKVERDKESQLGKYIGNSNCRAKTIRTVDDFFRGEEDSDEDAADNGFLDHSENECAYEDRDESSIGMYDFIYTSRVYFNHLCIEQMKNQCHTHLLKKNKHVHAPENIPRVTLHEMLKKKSANFRHYHHYSIILHPL